jgi:FixJ family two-component response regulator
MAHLIGVVDDDASVLRALTRLLLGVGFAVRTFRSGEELLAADDLGTLSCLILDVQLAGLNGFQVQQRLARARHSIPIVFISAADDDATREAAHRVANSRYLSKPFDEQALLVAIHALLANT